jgi:D-alanyl-D-alanine carboxypeptidase/D-alanyl-D-alanine-endopeptidase (penicillin-binding protein 4)
VAKSRPNSIGIDHGLDKGAWIIQGELPKDHAKLDYTLAVEDPAEFAASLLKSALEQRGIQVTGKSRARHLYPLEALEEGKPSTERAKSLLSRFLPEQKLTSHESVKLIETVKIMMKMSHNLYAELLLRKLGEESAGIGSLETGIAAVKAFLEKTGTSQEELNISDGSGMSRTDLITPRSIVRLLLYMERHPEAKLFEDTLPVSGLDGTLEHRMKKSSARGHIRAKTGTSAFVNTLSGYAYTKNGEKLAFSIMVNNLTLPAQEIRGVVDHICALMTDYDCEKDAANHD